MAVPEGMLIIMHFVWTDAAFELTDAFADAEFKLKSHILFKVAFEMPYYILKNFPNVFVSKRLISNYFVILYTSGSLLLYFDLQFCKK